MPIESEITPDVEEQIALNEPIKIRWTGTARSMGGRDYARASFESEPRGDVFLGVHYRCFTRQKTNVVVKTEEEAERLLGDMEYLHDADGITWWTPQMGASFRRVRDELIDALEERGYTVSKDGMTFDVEEGDA